MHLAEHVTRGKRHRESTGSRPLDPPLLPATVPGKRVPVPRDGGVPVRRTGGGTSARPGRTLSATNEQPRRAGPRPRSETPEPVALRTHAANEARRRERDPGPGQVPRLTPDALQRTGPSGRYVQWPTCIVFRESARVRPRAVPEPRANRQGRVRCSRRSPRCYPD